ncbi:MAG: hypothetical protein WCK93_13265 [Nitrosomonadales bacterium]
MKPASERTPSPLNTNTPSPKRGSFIGWFPAQINPRNPRQSVAKETEKLRFAATDCESSLECATLVALCRAGLATPAGKEKEKLQNQSVRRGKPRLQKAAASRRTPNFFAADFAD